MRRAHGQSGFTIAELLIALAVTAGAMLLLFSGHSLAGRIWDRGAQMTSADDELLVAQQVFSGWIESALPLGSDSGARTLRLTEQEISFVRLSPLGAPIARRERVLIALEAEGEGTRITLHSAPEDGSEAEEERLLLASPNRLAFYHYTDDKWRPAGAEGVRSGDLIAAGQVVGNEIWPVLLARIGGDLPLACLSRPDDLLAPFLAEGCQ